MLKNKKGTRRTQNLETMLKLSCHLGNATLILVSNMSIISNFDFIYLFHLFYSLTFILHSFQFIAFDSFNQREFKLTEISANIALDIAFILFDCNNNKLKIDSHV